ncbi:alpha/beta fold hydrolase [Nocardia amikacinitolerans]|uniref:alpha/beta fold hydrolase n=1 Tax=Nocardia amikacinitolerans TaxID=756689 RepID=UPI0020A51DDA|nr:alpha/beta fold hydrolase [Nocardia amikacinitolerans]MCP2279316.1 Pimeloyl-ACP methyl ester carboxylesterase [Nocardia amikacinitolerans]
MPTSHINGAELAYIDTGLPPRRPFAPTIVFGHGLLFGGWMFEPQIEALRSRYRCVAIDFRGQGYSAPTPSGYDMDTLADDVVALIDHLDLAPVHYVGLSMGGFVGQRIAARRGELLRSLTLLSTSAEAQGAVHAAKFKLLALAYRLAGTGMVRDRAANLLFGPVFRASTAGEPVIAEWARRLSRSERAGIHRAIVGVADRDAILPELDRIDVPTLVVVGADDVDTPPDKAKQIADHIAGATLEIVPNCGHTCTLEQPEAITELIARFVKTTDDVAAARSGR